MQPLWKTGWRSLKKWNTELTYDAHIPCLYIFSKKTKTLIQKDICTPMFNEELFTIARIWKQPKCPSLYECIKKLWYIYIYIHTHTYIYNVILLSHKRNEILPFATTWINQEDLIPSEINQTMKGKCHMISYIYGI